MDFVRRMREALASLFGRGARTLEKTAEGLESAADDLRAGDTQDAGDSGYDEQVTVIRRAEPSAEPEAPPPAAERAASERGAQTATVDEERPEPEPAEPDVAQQAPGEGERQRAGGRGQPEAAPETSVAELAEGTVRDVRAKLDTLSAADLRELRDVEQAGKGRKTLLAAIDKALADANP